MTFTANSYWIVQAQVPLCLVQQPSPLLQQQLQQRMTPEGLVMVDLCIHHGRIAALMPSGGKISDLKPDSDLKSDPRLDPGLDPELKLPEPAFPELSSLPIIDQRGGQVWPCFVDLHTHLDKGHCWPRSPNPDGSFQGALDTVRQDAARHWTPEDVYQRMEFGLQCSYVHGTQALRTHLDSAGSLADIVWPVFEQLRREWGDRLLLQGVCLVPIDYYLTPAGEQLADRVAAAAGILGGVVLSEMGEALVETSLDRLFHLAQSRRLAVDLHVDESGNPDDRGLAQVAAVKLRRQFSAPVLCGHCCSLAVQPPEVVAGTIAQVKAAEVGVVSLPLCNLYLQDRQPRRTPHWRGITLLHELHQGGVAVALASDNCRDPFYGFGDHDMLEVFREAVRIAHLDFPYGSWPRVVTQTPGQWMGDPATHLGTIALGEPANLILFRGRSFSELLSRSQHDRRVFRQGKEITAQLPDYATLDSLWRSP